MGRPLHRLPADRRPRRAVDGPETDDAASSAIDDDPRRGRAASRASRSGRRSSPFGPPADRRFLKAESLQPIGAFKIRGAYVAVASLPPDERARGVITYSSGNHAQGVARAARLLGAPAVVVMPSDAPGHQARAGRRGRRRDRRRRHGQRRAPGASPSAIAAERGLAIIPPFDDDRIIAGQGTVGLEIVEDLPDVAAVLVPIGGGGLASGVATAVRALAPDVRVIGVEPELAADARDRWRAGRIVRWPADGRLADDRRRDSDPGTRASGRSPTCARYLDGDRHGLARRRSRPASASRPNRAGSSSSRRARCRSPPLAFHAAEAGLDGLDGADRGRRQRRQRRPRALPRLPRGAAPGLSVRGLAAARASLVGRVARPSRRSRDPDLGQLHGRARRSARAASRVSARIQPTTIAMIAVEEDHVAGDPHDARRRAAGPRAAVGPHGRTSVA